MVGEEAAITIADCESGGRKIWSSELQELFLETLADTGQVERAVAATGLTRKAIYRHRRQDVEFDAQWVAALQCGYERIESALIAHALGARPAGINGQELDVETALAALRLNQRAVVLGKTQARGRKPRRYLTRAELTGAILARLAVLEREDKVLPEHSALPSPR